MTTEEIKHLPIEQKLRMMEVLWDDLKDRFDRGDVAEEHKELLDQRRQRVQSGKSQMLDWDAVKSAIGRP